METLVGIVIVGGFFAFLGYKYLQAKKRREENAKNPGSGGGGGGTRPPNVVEK